MEIDLCIRRIWPKIKVTMNMDVRIMKSIIVLLPFWVLLVSVSCVVGQIETDPISSAIDSDAQATITAIDDKIEKLVDSKISAESTKIAMPTQTPIIIEKIVTKTPYVTPTRVIPTPTSWADVHCITDRTYVNGVMVKLIPVADCDNKGIKLQNWNIRESDSLVLMTEIYGSILNERNYTVSDIDIEFQIYNSNGFLIHSDWAYISELAKGRSKSFISMGFKTELEDISAVRFIGINRNQY